MTAPPGIPFPNAVLWSAPTSWMTPERFPGDDEGWDFAAPVRAERVGLSEPDRVWLNSRMGYSMDALGGVDPEQVAATVGAITEPVSVDTTPVPARTSDGFAAQTVAQWRQDVLDVIDNLAPCAATLRTDGAIVEYAGVLMRGWEGWAVVEVAFSDRDSRHNAVAALAAHDQVRVLDLPDGPLGPGLLHPYPRFDDHAIAVVLDTAMSIEDVPWLFGQYMGPDWDNPAGQGGANQSKASGGSLYLASEEGSKGRVFAVERNLAGRTVLQPILRCQNLRVAMRVADLLTEATRTASPDADTALAYAEEYLTHGSIVAVRGELGLPTSGFVTATTGHGRRRGGR